MGCKETLQLATGFFKRLVGEPSRRISQLCVFDFTIEAAFPSIRTQRPSPFSSRSTLSSESILGVLQGLILIQVRFTQTTINRRSVVRNYVHQFWHSHIAGIPAGMKQLATILHPKLFCYVLLVNHLVFPSIPPPKFLQAAGANLLALGLPRLLPSSPLPRRWQRSMASCAPWPLLTTTS